MTSLPPRADQPTSPPDTTSAPSARLPGVDVPLSRLVLGTMTFGDTVDATGAARLLDLALDAGMTGVDTANAYATGVTEDLLGDLLPGRRDRIVLATKAGMPHPDHGDHAPLSAPGLRASLDGSLRRLKVDHVDLFYLHQPDRRTPIRETLGAVADLVTEGKIRALGVSNFAAWQIAEVNHAAEAVGAPRPVVAQQLYNLVARRVEEEYLEFAPIGGLLTMVYNPLAGGLLTGRHHLGEEPSSGRFGDSRLAGMYRQRYWDPQLFEAVTALARVAGESGIGLVELSLRWLLGRDGVDALLLGASNEEQLSANLAAAQAGPLPSDVIDACDAVGTRLRGPMPAYNR
ncbi:aldo/keto reductase [Plantactinospora mayteni]|uniref:Aldo/keto reductase n=1 Tax=Plantactinospora mayteni TaxID=566021 RepID=A0ABQ4F087_9ACTN|nr:aldo/keto reductase [Plantactinospora mayteni]GIH00314.1 aldo/keto reductase [Plantactinospora mayteni]